jgi:hypothetical protein
VLERPSWLAASYILPLYTGYTNRLIHSLRPALEGILLGGCNFICVKNTDEEVQELNKL